MSTPRQLASFTRARRETLARVAPLTQEQLDFFPASGKWGVGEVLDHLAKVDAIYRGEIAELIRRAEAGERPYLRRSFKDIDVSMMGLPKALLPLFEIPFTLSSYLMPRALAGRMAAARWIPIHAPDRTIPDRGRPKQQLVAGLESSLSGFETLFAQHERLDFDRLVHQHPLFGINTVPQMLEVLLLHEHRHQSQLAEIQTHRGFPPVHGRS